MASSSSSTSSSTSFIPDYPQSDFLMSVAQQAQGIAGQMLDWGNQAYQKNQTLADSIIQEGNLYASPARIGQDMGMAEAGVAQSFDAQRQASLRDLQSFGIDPSAGRYQSLNSAERTRQAAAAAGAGNQQRMATEATGRAIRSEGANLSMQNQAVGGQNMRIANDYLKTASELKYPPLGNRSNSSNQSSGGNDSGSQPGGSRGGGGGGPNGGGGSGTSPQQRQRVQDDSGGGGSRGGGGGGLGNMNNARTMSVPGGGSPDQNYGYDNGYGQFGSDNLDSGDKNFDPYSAYDPGGSTWGTNDQTDPLSNWGDQFGSSGDVQGQQGSWGGDWGQTPDTSGGGGGDNSASYSTGDAGGGYDSTDFSSSDQSDSSGFAMGGDVDEADDDNGGGGYVSPDMSPSGGQQTDDVPATINQTGGQARLNADEFVLPRDVVLWKGQEFFQKLIAQSRKSRVTAPAHPTQG